ncbi:MAG: hypothetical protein ACRYF5_06175 [Janthinobacterium lividum]
MQLPNEEAKSLKEFMAAMTKAAEAITTTLPQVLLALQGIETQLTTQSIIHASTARTLDTLDGRPPVRRDLEFAALRFGPREE